MGSFFRETQCLREKNGFVLKKNTFPDTGRDGVPPSPLPLVASVPSVLFPLRASSVASRLCLDQPAPRSEIRDLSPTSPSVGTARCAVRDRAQSRSPRTTATCNLQPVCPRPPVRLGSHHTSLATSWLCQRTTCNSLPSFEFRHSSFEFVRPPNSENRNPSCRAVLSRHSFNDGGSF